MKPRLNYFAAAPEIMESMLALDKAVATSGLEHDLMLLVKIRASQINACAFCIKMHTKDARAHGETEERLYLLDAWREAPIYTDRERAALGWTEALTLVSQTHALIGTINALNRMSIGFRSVPSVEARAPRRH